MWILKFWSQHSSPPYTQANCEQTQNLYGFTTNFWYLNETQGKKVYDVYCDLLKELYSLDKRPYTPRFLIQLNWFHLLIQLPKMETCLWGLIQ